jgi:CheY-like chemotaxis protein
MSNEPPADRSIILVVEDEPLLRMFASDMVEDAGYSVVEAANATEAVSILEQRTDIRIVFTDIDMPHGIDGIKLAACIRDRWPPIDIIIVSGKPFPVSARLPDRAVFFPKPYQQVEIIAMMARMGAMPSNGSARVA